MRTYRNEDLRRPQASSRVVASTSYSLTHSGISHGCASNVVNTSGECSSAIHVQKQHGTTTVIHCLVGGCDVSEEVESTRGNRTHLYNKGMPSDIPKRTIRTLMPVRRTTLSKSTTHDIRDELCDVEVSEIPTRARLPASVLASEKEQRDSRAKKPQGSSSMFPRHDIRVSHTKSLRMVRRRHMSDFHMEPLMKKRKSTDGEESNPNASVSGSAGHRHSRAEASRRDELINCTCGFAEEDGLMIQCDLCLCWQHGVCNNIEYEDDVPDKYICVMCQHPLRERPSKHFLRDQDWLKDGCLPTLRFRSKSAVELKQRTIIFKRCQDLIGTLLRLRRFIHSLRVKVNIAEMSDHPKLYLWNQSWEKAMFPGGGSASSSIHNTIEPLLPEIDDLKEENLLLGKCNINELEESPKPLDPQLSTSGGSVCLDADGNSTECQSTDLDGEAGDISSMKDNVNFLTEVCDNADPFYGRDDLYCSKGEDISLEFSQSQMELSDTLPDLSQDLILDSTINIGNETEIETGRLTDNEVGETSHNITNDITSEDANETSNSVQDESLDSKDFVKTSSPIRDEESIDVNELQLPFFQKDLINLASSMASKLDPLNEVEREESNVAPPVREPQPEAPIDLTECRLTLLDHIEVLQVQLELHLSALETQIAGLERTDPYLLHDERTDHQTKETMQMLLQDLSLLHDVAVLN